MKELFRVCVCLSACVDAFTVAVFANIWLRGWLAWIMEACALQIHINKFTSTTYFFDACG